MIELRFHTWKIIVLENERGYFSPKFLRLTVKLLYPSIIVS